jgi:lipid-A-disaccharide synthase
MLELALLDTPTVAAYRTSRNTYLLGRLLIRHLTHFTLVNLIGGRTIIPELLQDEITPERIAQELGRLLHDQQARHQVLAGLAEVRERLGGPGASARAAESVLALLRDRRA